MVNQSRLKEKGEGRLKRRRNSFTELKQLEREKRSFEDLCKEE